MIILARSFTVSKHAGNKKQYQSHLKTSMEIVSRFLDLLPTFAQIEQLLNGEPEAAYILRRATENMEQLRLKSKTLEALKIEEVSYLVQCLTDKFWERIHTGHFSEVPMATRKIYAISNCFKIFYMLIESTDVAQIEICSAILDDALLVGTTQELYAQSDQLVGALMQFFDELTGQQVSRELLPVMDTNERMQHECDVQVYDCPTVMEFKKQCFDTLQPAVLLNTIAHWPALEKWHDLNYIDKVAGSRCVPIEIGSNYTTDEWSQQIVKIRDFLRRQFAVESIKTTPDKTNEIEYLAQHELFDQIPTLKADVRIPDYCTIGKNSEAVDIKAWLGPKGTISPMHYDPKHNFLCQVFGAKFIILAAPEDTSCLYPHESDFLGNTSKIDAANVDLKQFPLSKNVRFFKLFLQRGDCLYLPPKWWHYVRSESPSFSVSFWWE